MKPNKDETIVLDTSALVSGFEPLGIRNLQYSVPEVEQELADYSMSQTRFRAAVDAGRLIIRKPQTKYVEKVRASSKELGDWRFLSEADKQVLALAVELKETGCPPKIITDDYSIQNVASQLGIEFASLATFGIRYRFHWVLYCPACHLKHRADYQPKFCRICGSTLKRKPTGKETV